MQASDQIVEVVNPANKCCSSDCTNVAEFTVYWPGQTRQMCQRCAERANGVAEAMGFTLPVGKIPPRQIVPQIVEVPNDRR